MQIEYIYRDQYHYHINIAELLMTQTIPEDQIAGIEQVICPMEVKKLIRLLVIADDLTGALDTGIQFGSRAALVKLYTYRQAVDIFENIPDHIEVLIIDTETRHSDCRTAYERIYRLVDQAKRQKISCIYKKTDSGMRGNIGSELSAALTASGGDCIHFVPAFPQIGRTTEDGIQYIDGVPVAESVFGRDPFEPVRHSQIRDIVGEQCATECHVLNEAAEGGGYKGILLYNCKTQDDLQKIAKDLKRYHPSDLLAGCAGFAAVLPEMVGIRSVAGQRPGLCRKLLVVCGSLNPVSLRQMDAAEKNGALRVKLSNRQKLKKDFFDTEEGMRFVKDIALKIQEYRCAMIESTDMEGEESSASYALSQGMEAEEIRHRISENLGMMLRRLLEEHVNYTIFITGGDTLLSFMENIGLDKLSPICELYPGVVLSGIEYNGTMYHLISKSGGFGNENLLLDIQKIINAKEEKDEETGCGDIDGRSVWKWTGNLSKSLV